MTNVNNGYLREEYIFRINKVIDYIETHVSEELSLVVLANVANFSPYHFHRIFCAIVGEPLSKYIQRIRLEKAALSLVNHPKSVVAQVALKYGFPNQASFSRAFKKHFGFSASHLRMDAGLLKSKKCKMESKTGKDDLNSFLYNEGVKDLSFSVEVKAIQEMPVIYIRNIGMFGGEAKLFQKLFKQLFNWADARGIIHYPDTKVLSLYHDHPEVTDEARFRTSLCLTVTGEIEVEGEIGKMVVPGGKYAVGHFCLDSHEYKEAWDIIWGSWLPESGYQPDDRPCFEIYLNQPEEHPEKKSIVDMYVPIKPL